MRLARESFLRDGAFRPGDCSPETMLGYTHITAPAPAPASLPPCLTALTAPGRAAPSPCTAPSYSRAPDWGQDWALTYVNWALTDAREVALTLPRLSGA